MSLSKRPYHDQSYLSKYLTTLDYHYKYMNSRESLDFLMDADYKLSEDGRRLSSLIAYAEERDEVAKRWILTSNCVKPYVHRI